MYRFCLPNLYAVLYFERKRIYGATNNSRRHSTKQPAAYYVSTCSVTAAERARQGQQKQKPPVHRCTIRNTFFRQIDSSSSSKA